MVFSSMGHSGPDSMTWGTLTASIPDMVGLSWEFKDIFVVYQLMMQFLSELGLWKVLCGGR